MSGHEWRKREKKVHVEALDVLDDDGLDGLDTDESVAQQVRALDSFSFEQRFFVHHVC